MADEWQVSLLGNVIRHLRYIRISSQLRFPSLVANTFLVHLIAEPHADGCDSHTQCCCQGNVCARVSVHAWVCARVTAHDTTNTTIHVCVCDWLSCRLTNSIVLIPECTCVMLGCSVLSGLLIGYFSIVLIFEGPMFAVCKVVL